jgi:photosystem II stability/assembly factor-like uncharacterized protein
MPHKLLLNLYYLYLRFLLPAALELRGLRQLSLYKFVIISLITSITVGCNDTTSDTNLPSYLKSQFQNNISQPQEIIPITTNGPHGRPVRCFASRGNALFLGTDRGIYQSLNKGVSWEHLNNDLADHRIDAIVLSENALIVATSEGLYRSVNSGTTWESLDTGGLYPFATQYVTALLPVKGGLLKVTQAMSVGRSEDNGKTWSMAGTGETLTKLVDGWERGEFYQKDIRARYKPKPPVPTSVNSIAIQGDTTFTSLDGTLYQSTDEGRSWKPATNNIPSKEDVVMVSVNNNSLFVSTRGGGLYRRDAPEGEWKDISVDDMEVRDVVSFGGVLFAATSGGLFHSVNGGLNWSVINNRSNTGMVHDLFVFEGTLFAGAGGGAYRLRPDTLEFEEVSDGLYSSVTRLMVTETNTLFAITGPDEYRTDDSGDKRDYQSYGIYRSNDSGQNWAPANGDLKETRIYDGASIGNSIFLATHNGVYRSDDDGVHWSHAGELENPSVTADEYHKKVVTTLFTDGETLYAGTFVGLFRSVDYGNSWGLAAGNFYAGWITGMSAIDNDLFVVGPMGKIFRIDTSLRKAYEVPTATFSDVRVIASSGSTLYAGAYTRSPASTPVGNLFKLDNALTNTTWERLKADNLKGELRVLWVDPIHREVIIVGTSDGLYWSNDGGQHFDKHEHRGTKLFNEVFAITKHRGQLWMGTNAGSYYVLDRIARGKWYERAYEFSKVHSEPLLGVAVCLLLVLILSTRLILLILTLELWPFKFLAIWFYLTPVGRWKLYRRYRRSLKHTLITNRDANRYVDLPYEWNGTTSQLAELKLSDRFASLSVNERVIVIAEGGRGKSTLCRFLALQAIQGQALFGKGYRVPVVVEGLAYNGNMLETLTNALKQHRAYVNSTIVHAQLEAGYLLVLFDGLSEIREASIAAAESLDLPSFIQQHPDTPFMFTSRNNLPSSIVQAMGEGAIIKLKDVDKTTERPFLKQYIKHESEVDALRSEIKLHFPTLPRIPLMLKLVATVYNRTGAVPHNRVTLFADYIQYLLRPELTGVEEPAGLNFVLRHLVRETYISSGGDHGFTIEQGEEALDKIKDRLKNYDINLSPIKLLNLLVRAGLLVRVGDQLTFFHHSFESYFAARALESIYRQGRKKPILECIKNPRFSEVSDFLSEIFEETNETLKLEALIAGSKQTSSVKVN